jgi:hypothetical protein
MTQREIAVKIAIVLVVAVFVFFAYTVVHEAGHALAATAFGARVTEFNVNFVSLAAHAGYIGELSTGQQAVISLAGLGANLLACLAVIFGVPPSNNLPLRLLKLQVTFSVAGSLLVWVVFPILVAMGVQPGTDDVLNFLTLSGISPLALALISALVIAGLLSLYVRREMASPAGYRLREVFTGPLSAGSRTSLGVLGGLLVMGIGLSVALGGFSSERYGTAFTPPDGYRLISEVGLEEPVSGEVIAAFSLAEEQTGGVLLVLRGVKTRDLRIGLQGPDGFSLNLISVEDYESSMDTSQYENTLAAGDYQVILDAVPSRGKIQVYVRP